MGITRSPPITMRVLVLCAIVAVAAAKPRSLASISTPMSRGGGRIVGGDDAFYGEFPHQIALLRGGPGGSLMCGGSVVHENWVVTAGHCCDGQSASRLGVRVGSHHLHSEDADQEDFAVKRVVLHEDYDSWTINNDICLLEIDGTITMGEHVKPIGFPDDGQEYDEGTTCTVTGWGTTSEGGSLASILQKVDVPVVSDDHCRDSYGQNDIADSMICAGFDQGGKDSCQGDSGGPFMCGNQLSGVVSWGYGCAEAGYPGVYTQTSYFVGWLNSNMS